ncbi:MAG: hypothetical protein WC371_00860 [Parachlamydiales bacterium]|jgi:hypothetical protein
MSASCNPVVPVDAKTLASKSPALISEHAGQAGQTAQKTSGFVIASRILYVLGSLALAAVLGLYLLGFTVVPLVGLSLGVAALVSGIIFHSNEIVSEIEAEDQSVSGSAEKTPGMLPPDVRDASRPDLSRQSEPSLPTAPTDKVRDILKAFNSLKQQYQTHIKKQQQTDQKRKEKLQSDVDFLKAFCDRHPAGELPEFKKEAPVRGIANPGNNCFINADLQFIFRSPFLRRFLAGDRAAKVKELIAKENQYLERQKEAKKKLLEKALKDLAEIETEQERIKQAYNESSIRLNQEKHYIETQLEQAGKTDDEKRILRENLVKNNEALEQAKGQYFNALKTNTQKLKQALKQVLKIRQSEEYKKIEQNIESAERKIQALPYVAQIFKVFVHRYANGEDLSETGDSVRRLFQFFQKDVARVSQEDAHELFAVFQDFLETVTVQKSVKMRQVHKQNDGTFAPIEDEPAVDDPDGPREALCCPYFISMNIPKTTADHCPHLEELLKKDFFQEELDLGSDPVGRGRQNSQTREYETHYQRLKITCAFKEAPSELGVHLKRYESLAAPALVPSFSEPQDASLLEKFLSWILGGQVRIEKKAAEVSSKPEWQGRRIDQPVEIPEQIILHGGVELAAGQPDQAYALNCFVVQMGGLQSGHYVSYERVFENGAYQWYYSSDTRVGKVTREAALQAARTAYFFQYLSEPAAAEEVLG